MPRTSPTLEPELSRVHDQLSDRSLAVQLIEAAPLACMLVAEDGTIVHTNAAVGALFGWPPGELVGLPLEVLVPEAAREAQAQLHSRFVREAPQRNMGTGVPLEAVRRDGSRCLIDVQLTPLELGTSHLVLVLARDVTLEDEHRRAREQYARELELTAQRKNQVLGTVAHDLRNPLGVVFGYATYLLDTAGTLSPEETRQMLERIRTASQFMRALVDDLLDFAAIESGTLELRLAVVDPVAFLQNELEVNSPIAAQKQMRIVVETEEGLPRVRVDPMRFEQAIDNLISNAVKYSEPGSRVWLSAHRAGDEVVFVVRDEGRGIPEDFLGEVFQAFAHERATGTRGEKSTGLGLAIVRRIVEAHGARIWATSELGRGSSFFVAVKCADAAKGGAA